MCERLEKRCMRIRLSLSVVFRRFVVDVAAKECCPDGNGASAIDASGYICTRF